MIMSFGHMCDTTLEVVAASSPTLSEAIEEGDVLLCKVIRHEIDPETLSI